MSIRNKPSIKNRKVDARPVNFLLLWSVFFYFTGWLLSSSVSAETTGKTANIENDRRVIMVLVSGWDMEMLRELMDQEESKQWMGTAYIGGMNLRTAGSMNMVNNYVTLGAGNRSVGSTQVTGGYHIWEMDEDKGVAAGDMYEQLMGIEPGAEEILVTDIRRIVDNNLSQPYQAVAGELGEVLKRHGIGRVLLGNLDAGKETYRPGAFITMDHDGRTPLGDVSDRTLRADDDMAYGVSTDYDYLLSRMEAGKKQAHLIVLELGDFYRLQLLREEMDPQLFLQKKERIMRDTARFMNQAVQRQQEGELIIFLSPMVNQKAVEEDALMAPVVLIPPGSVSAQAVAGQAESLSLSEGETGVLYSPTTRREGIVANTDLAPTILNWLQLPIPDHMEGRVIQWQQHKQAIAEFWENWEQIYHVYQSRRDVLYNYIIFQVILLILATFILLKVTWNQARTAIRIALLTLVLSPALFLLLPLIPYRLSAMEVLTVLGISAFILAILLQRLPWPLMFAAVAFINWMPVVLDVVFDLTLMKRSYLGYDPLIGARYYGIGNEYMGVVIGSVMLFISTWMEHDAKRVMKGVVAALLIGITVILAAPFWGTNAGGAIAAIAGFSVAYTRLYQIPINRKFILRGLLLGSVIMLLLGAIHLIQGDQQSHIGRAINWIIRGEIRPIADIASRKLEMNWRLIQVSSWSKVFVTSLFVLAIFVFPARGVMRVYQQQYPHLIAGISGIVAAALVALLVNDSGVVAAAMIIIYAVVPLLYLGLQREREATG